MLSEEESPTGPVFHPIWQLNRNWMASMKSAGGLTRGRGMTEIQRTKWLLSTPTCAEIENAVRTITGMSFQTSEQHDQREKQGIVTTQLKF